MIAGPDPTRLHPVAGQQRVVFVKPLVSNPSIEVRDFSYYDDPDDPLAFEHDAVQERAVAERWKCACVVGRAAPLMLNLE